MSDDIVRIEGDFIRFTFGSRRGIMGYTDIPVWHVSTRRGLIRTCRALLAQKKFTKEHIRLLIELAPTVAAKSKGEQL